MGSSGFPAVLAKELDQDPAAASHVGVDGAVAAAGRVRAWLDAREMAWVAEAARRRREAATGSGDVGRFVSTQTGVSAREGKRRAKIAGELPALPGVADELAAGGITLEHAQVFTDAHSDQALAGAVERDQKQLLEKARESDPDRFRQDLARWKQRQSSDDGAAAHERMYRRRFVKTFMTDDAMFGLRAELDPVAGAQVKAALGRLADRRWRHQEHKPGSPTHMTRPRYMADALIDLAHLANSTPTATGTATGDNRGGSRGANPTDDGGAGPVVGPGGDHLLPVIMIDHTRLTSDQGRCQLIDGTPLPVATAQRAICDNSHRVAVTDPSGDILSLSRKTRLATPDQRIALQLRDQGCVWPACDTGPDWCQAHHLKPWRQGGPTNLDNLALVCTKHHHLLLHEGHWHITRDPTGTWQTHRPE